MAEFEGSRRIMLPSRTVFDAAADVSSMASWLPTTMVVEPSGPDQVHVEGRAEGHHYDAEGLFRARPEQLRLEWGSRDDDDYSGWLQVADSGEGASEATLHLSFRGDAEQHVRGDADQVRAGIDETLQRLEQRVTSA